MTAHVRRIGFAYNPTSEAATELRERAAGWCAVRGLDHWASPAAEFDDLLRELPTTDVLVVLGGDGTFLRGARAVVETGTPILGVNVGKVGFLSKVEAEGLDRVLGLLVEGSFRIEERMALEGRIIRSGTTLSTHHALNDVVVARGSLARVCRLDVSIDASHFATFIADGLVVASPTGSTGYSFSAGGPILEPTSRNLIVTPIAAYLATLRSVTVSATQTVTCTIVQGEDAVVSIDGWIDQPLKIGDRVSVTEAEQPINFVELQGAAPFWDLVRQKVDLLPR